MSHRTILPSHYDQIHEARKFLIRTLLRRFQLVNSLAASEARAVTIVRYAPWVFRPGGVAVRRLGECI